MDRNSIIKKVIAKLQQPLMSNPAYVGDFLEYLKEKGSQKDPLKKRKKN